MTMNTEVQDLVNQYKYHLVVAFILLSCFFIFINFPLESQYFKGADESNYYRQGKLLAEHGLSGFAKIRDVYLQTPELQDAPNPLRLGANLSAAFCLSVNDSYRAMSMFCLLNFALLLAGTFRFADRYWGSTVALFTVILMAFSPLEMAMARRALMDIPAMTSMAFSCFAFWLWMDTGKLKYMATLISFLTWSILLKEVNIILLPFFAIVLLFFKWKGKARLSFWEMLIALATPGVISLAALLLAYGYQGLLDLVNTIHHAVSNSSYSAVWGQGPWYRILVDYLLLSPYVMLLAVFYAGYHFTKENADKNTGFILALAVYLVIVFSLLPKNVRYAILLDFPIRLLAANGIVLLLSHVKVRKISWLPVVLLLFLVVSDVMLFLHYFITNAIYDPISYNLLKVSRIIP